MELVVERKIRGLLPHCVVNGVLFASAGSVFYASRNLGASWERMASIHQGWTKLISSIRIVDGVLRKSVFVAVVGSHRSVLAATSDGHFTGRVDDTKLTRAVHSPLTFKPLRRGLCLTTTGLVYAGEYRFNFGERRGQAARNPVHVWRSHDFGVTFEIAYTFPRGTIRHVHALIEDPFVAGRLWIATGDEDDESSLLFTDDDFRSVQTFKTGSQRYRATDLAFDVSALTWGMDSPRETSYVIRCDRTSGTEQILGETPCPVYYAARNEAGHLFFSDSVEPGSSVKSRETSLYGIVGERPLHRLISFRSDFFAGRLLIGPFAQIHLPVGCMPSNYVYFYPRCTIRDDNTLYVGRVID